MNFIYGWNPVAEFVLDEMDELNIPIQGVVIDDAFIGQVNFPHRIRVLTSSQVIFEPDDTVINCIGYKDLYQRIKIGERLLELGVLKSFISHQSRVHSTAVIGDGTVLVGDVTIERSCHVGRHGLLWGGSRVCHDSTLGSGVFLASGAIIGGACRVGEACALGFNSSMREKSSMPDGTKVGANRFWRPLP